MNLQKPQQSFIGATELFLGSFGRTVYLLPSSEVLCNGSQRLLHVDIERGEMIGAGGFSRIFKGLWLSRSNAEVAIKVFNEVESMNVSVDFTVA